MATRVTRCHSLSLVFTRCTTRCTICFHSLPLAVTQCTTRLSFYNRSVEKFKHVQTFQLTEINLRFFEDVKFSVIIQLVDFKK